MALLLRGFPLKSKSGKQNLRLLWDSQLPSVHLCSVFFLHSWLPLRTPTTILTFWWAWPIWQQRPFCDARNSKDSWDWCLSTQNAVVGSFSMTRKAQSTCFYSLWLLLILPGPWATAWRLQGRSVLSPFPFLPCSPHLPAHPSCKLLPWDLVPGGHRNDSREAINMYSMCPGGGSEFSFVF